MRVLVGIQRISDLLARFPDVDDWLGQDERARLAGMRHLQRRAQFRAGHGYARQLLTRLGGGEPSDWMLTRGEHGAPLATREGVASGLHLSISHSGDFVACAVGPVALGVDIECAPRTRDFIRLAKTLYPQDFLRELQTANAASQRGLFFHRWTLDEAHAKAHARGLMRQTLRSQTWRPVAEGAADAWTWERPDAWLALVFATPLDEPLSIDLDGCAGRPTARAWRCQPIAINDSNTAHTRT